MTLKRKLVELTETVEGEEVGFNNKKKCLVEIEIVTDLTSSYKLGNT